MGRRDLARAPYASVDCNDVVRIALLRCHEVDAARLHDRGVFSERENAEVDRRSIGKETHDQAASSRPSAVARQRRGATYTCTRLETSEFRSLEERITLLRSESFSSDKS